MKKNALKYLVCPKCQTALSLKVIKKEQNEVIEGDLICKKNHHFSITRGIPRFVAKQSDKLKRRTALSFGFEWQTFAQLLPEYKRNFLQYVSPIKSSFFKSKLILDAGCGMGRHTYWPAKFGARHVFGVDFSDSVEVAYNHCQPLNNVTIVQADIYHLPFKRIFDYSFSIGVLHHLPDPQKGFNAVVSTVKRGGLASIWVYGRKHNFSNVYIYEAFRQITRHFPHLIVLWLSYFFGAAVHLINQFEILFSKLLKINNIDSWPFGYYARFPLVVKINDAFDVLATPKSRYYLKSQIQNWFLEAGFKRIKLLYLRRKSIKGFGHVTD